MTETYEWPKEAGKITIAVMGSSGDSKSVFGQDEADAAQKLFDELVASGHLPFKLEGDGEGTQMDKFEPNERILMVPRMVGG